MEPIQESSRIRRLERALAVIEGLTFLQDDADPFASQVYMIAHSALNHCQNPHENWLHAIEESEASLKELNIIDVEPRLSPA